MIIGGKNFSGPEDNTTISETTTLGNSSSIEITTSTPFNESEETTLSSISSPMTTSNNISSKPTTLTSTESSSVMTTSTQNKSESTTHLSNTTEVAPIIMSTQETTTEVTNKTSLTTTEVTESTTTGPSTSVPSVTTESNATQLAPIVLPTETSGALTSQSSNIEGSTLANMYPQAVRYSCPQAVNGCSGPKSCLYKNPDCSKFFHCNDGGQAFIMDCPIGLQWNDEQKICDNPENANCSEQN